MSYLSVSGLEQNGVNDSVEKLLETRTAGRLSENNAHPFLENIKASSPRQEWGKKLKRTLQATKNTTSSSSQRVLPLKQERATKSGHPTARVLPSYSSEGLSKPTLSRFHADNPSNIDSMPSVLDLIHPRLRRSWSDTLHLQEMTRIQKLSWEALLDRDRDVIIRSETGSGKTLAYALPTVHQILCDCELTPITREIGTIVMVMCPTRELVIQVENTFSTLLKFAPFLTVGAIHGGENRHKEKSRLRKGIPLLITTPGRLLDHLKMTLSFNVSNARSLIMDEADRLLDLGFERTIREIVELLMNKCAKASELKRVLVSATITEAVERLSHFALRPRITRIGETQDTFSIPATLEQHFMVVPTKHRLSVLVSFLKSQIDAGTSKIVVFVSTADGTEFLYYLLSRLQSPFLKQTHEGKVGIRKSFSRKYKNMLQTSNQHIHDPTEDVVTFDEDSETDADTQEPVLGPEASARAMLNVNVFKLHGNMSQVDRASVFHSFKFGNSTMKTEKGILFCTDVASRGLDMPHIDWIVHYDPPPDPTSYVHRIGRTARIGKRGNSILFLAPHEVGYAQYLSNFISSSKQEKKGTLDSHEDKSHLLSEKKYQTYLFYLTKLEPRSNHMWMHSMAKLERAITQLVMGQSSVEGEHQGKKTDDLSRIALFAYGSYIRSYAGMPKDLKHRFFSSSDLHLGHLAQSFGIEKSPTEIQRQLQRYMREDFSLGRRTQRRVAQNSGHDGDRVHTKSKRERIELEHKDCYHSMLAQKQRKATRDYQEKQREETNRVRHFHFTEFDA